jgi:hypothetical protein
MIYTRLQVIKALVGGVMVGSEDGTEIAFRSGQTPPTEAEIDVKLEEMVAAEPMRVLREQRDGKLAESDWWASSDLVMSNEKQIYRQQLRDMPAFATPTLDDSGRLLGVQWPVKPE